MPGSRSRSCAAAHTSYEILATIEEERPDLVVIGTHGRKGVSHALLGSVAEKIVRLSSAPVLTLRDRT